MRCWRLLESQERRSGLQLGRVPSMSRNASSPKTARTNRLGQIGETWKSRRKTSVRRSSLPRIAARIRRDCSIEDEFISNFEDLEGNDMPILLKGFCDLIVKEGEDYVIVDHKTVALVKQQDEPASLWTAGGAYWFWCAKSTASIQRMIFDQIKKTKTRWKPTDHAVRGRIHAWRSARIPRAVRPRGQRTGGNPAFDPETGVMQFLPNPFAMFDWEESWADFCEECRVARKWTWWIRSSRKPLRHRRRALNPITYEDSREQMPTTYDNGTQWQEDRQAEQLRRICSLNLRSDTRRVRTDCSDDSDAGVGSGTWDGKVAGDFGTHESVSSWSRLRTAGSGRDSWKSVKPAPRWARSENESDANAAEGGSSGLGGKMILDVVNPSIRGRSRAFPSPKRKTKNKVKWKVNPENKKRKKGISDEIFTSNGQENFQRNWGIETAW